MYIDPIHLLKKLITKDKRHWYDIWSKTDQSDGWSESSNLILKKAEEMQIDAIYTQGQGIRFIHVFCDESDVEALHAALGAEQYGFARSVNISFHKYYDRELIRLKKSQQKEKKGL